MIDARTPVIVGVAQVTKRPGTSSDLAHAAEPVALMAEAARLAQEDAGASGLLDLVDAVWVSQPLSRRYPDPAALVLHHLGLEGQATRYRALVGGNSPQLLVNEAAAAIQRGAAEACLVTGAESMYSRFQARKEGVDLAWQRPDMPPTPNEIGDHRPGTSDHENLHGASLPIEIYPLFETALRAKRGRDVSGHQAAVGRLWSRFAAVAAANPLAWTQEAYSPDDIVTPGPDNRVVTFPYTKRMCANLTVDQGAALILTSYETAQRLGIPEDRLVFPLAAADGHDHWFISERWSLGDSPAIRELGRLALEATGLGIDAVARFDLYSCFPSAVQVAMDALGIDPGDERPLTQTGGLAFFGGPGNNYVAHSIAEMVNACRADPGSVGLVTAVGWYLTKHSVGLYSTRPLDGGFQRVPPELTQARIDGLPRREAAGEYDGPATVEATAVAYSRGGEPERATVTALTDDGRRALAVSRDESLLSSIVTEPWEGRGVKVRTEEGVNQFEA